MRYVLLRALLCALILGGGGVLIGFLTLANNRCGGSACAGLIVIPIIMGLFGAGVGLIGGAITFWISKASRRPHLEDPNPPSGDVDVEPARVPIRPPTPPGPLLSFLAQQEELPWPDGVMGDRIKTVLSGPLAPEDLPTIIDLLKKNDPHLQEAGVLFAGAAIAQYPDLAQQVEVPLSELVRRDEHGPGLDNWVLKAIVEFLLQFTGPHEPRFTAVYRELAELLDRHNPPPEAEPASGPTSVPHHPKVRGFRDSILRNMAIRPHMDLVALLHAQAKLDPGPSERSDIIQRALDRHQSLIPAWPGPWSGPAAG